jgi:hypothetical protein
VSAIASSDGSLLVERSVGARARSWITRPAIACLALFGLYVCLSLLDDPRGYLGTDTGGKVATLRAMDARGDLDPDVGYWAEDLDPGGVVHPLALTYHVGDRWVNVTTLPMIYAAVPLYELGGLRAILLLPMLGGVLTALAARALARRLGGGSGDAAFWLVGLATPVVVYALDFWEHALGLAAMVWAVALLLDVAEGRSGWRSAAGGGLLFGVAATMRNEAFVYTLATGLVVGVGLVAQRRRDLLRCAVAGVAGFVVPIALNQLLERVVLGQSLRSARTSGAVDEGGANLARRGEEALSTTIGLNHYTPATADWLIGGLVVAFVALAAYAMLGPRRRTAIAIGALGAAAIVCGVRFSAGLGFVPGFLVASPLAVVGLVAATRDRRLLRPVAIAVVALPMVWLFQYSGGANPQWGGRYVLCSGVLLAVAGIVALGTRGPGALAPFAVVALLVTGAGVGWLAVRSHAVADAVESVVAGRDPVVTTGLPYFLREGGAFSDPGRRWLDAEVRRELPVAVDVLDRGGADRFTLVARFRRQAPGHLGPYERNAVRSIDFLSDIRLTVAQYRRA